MLPESIKQAKKEAFLLFQEERFETVSKRPQEKSLLRDSLGRVYLFLCEACQKKGLSFEEASRYVRSIWIEEGYCKPPKSLPRIIGEDGFLRMYAMGEALTVDLFLRLYDRVEAPLEEKEITLGPLFIEWNPLAHMLYDVDATPPDVFSKLFTSCRLRRDEELLEKIQSDLLMIAQVEDPGKRLEQTLGVLAHAGSYRELEGKVLKIPHFSKRGEIALYRARQHLIEEGVKTVSLYPEDKTLCGIYLCQGTELWPSQPSMMGSIAANFAHHGSATEAYAHSWRRIHKHLRDFSKKPLVAGHSMGGSLAIQIGLYSHELVESVYAFNPPLCGERDASFYQSLSEKRKDNIHVVANLDDFAFWRIGEKIVGSVKLFLGKTRWRYYPISFWDCLFLIPAFIKCILNIRHAFPAHQNLASLHEGYIYFEPTEEEKERENVERKKRFDYLHFFPKLYDPMKRFLKFSRRNFGWKLEQKYYENEVEIIALHERDLIDTLTEENEEELKRELEELSFQKQRVLKMLKSI